MLILSREAIVLPVSEGCVCVGGGACTILISVFSVDTIWGEIFK